MYLFVAAYLSDRQAKGRQGRGAVPKTPTHLPRRRTGHATPRRPIPKPRRVCPPDSNRHSKPIGHLKKKKSRRPPLAPHCSAHLSGGVTRTGRQPAPRRPLWSRSPSPGGPGGPSGTQQHNGACEKPAKGEGEGGTAVGGNAPRTTSSSLDLSPERCCALRPGPRRRPRAHRRHVVRLQPASSRAAGAGHAVRTAGQTGTGSNPPKYEAADRFHKNQTPLPPCELRARWRVARPPRQSFDQPRHRGERAEPKRGGEVEPRFAHAHCKKSEAHSTKTISFGHID